jgi:DNA-binding Lrp family transcriptional regulator
MTNATLKQIEHIQRLTARGFVGVLPFKDISKRIGKDIWHISKEEASELIQKLETTEGFKDFYK